MKKGLPLFFCGSQLFQPLDRPLGIQFVTRQVPFALRFVLEFALFLPATSHPRVGLTGLGCLFVRDFLQRSEGAVYNPEVVAERAGDSKVRNLVLPVEEERTVVGGVSVLAPFLTVSVVHDLARAEGVVAVGREVGHHGARVLEDLVPVPVLESEHLRGVRIYPGGEAGPRRIADGDVAMRLGEGNPAIYKSLDVRGLYLRMPSQRLDVVVQVVTDDKQDVRLVSRAQVAE